MKLSADEPLISFLKDIFDTNVEFSASHEEVFFDSFKDEQNPRATVLKCSDSRVQMESFDKTPQNGIFAIRNIGNQVATCEGSLDFGIRFLKTPFLLILGHSGCGAVQTVLSKQLTNIKAIDEELASMQLKQKDIKLAIIENVDKQVEFAIKKYQDLIIDNKLTIIGAIYDFRNDFGFGKGKLIATSINGEKNSQTIHTQIADKVKNFKFLNIR